MAGNSPTSPEPIRVLHVVGAMDRAGTETMIMNLVPLLRSGAVPIRLSRSRGARLRL